MYDILVYLFENCQQADLAYDRERVAKKLSAAELHDDRDVPRQRPGLRDRALCFGPGRPEQLLDLPPPHASIVARRGDHEVLERARHLFRGVEAI